MRTLIRLWPFLVLLVTARGGSEPWHRPCTGDDATGSHVIAYWRFEIGSETNDSGPNGIGLRLQGAKVSTHGRFGTALEPLAGNQVRDQKHAAVAPNHPALSPAGAFTLEAWIFPTTAFPSAGEVFLVDKKYAGHTDYQLTIGAPDKGGRRVLHARLGFGEDSDSFTSDSVSLDPGAWAHVAFTYDGEGSGQFYLNGASLGGGLRPGRGPIARGKLGVSIGDRTGSNYHAFPGWIDEVRICSGVREFRRATFALVSDRTAFIRMEPDAILRFAVTNLQSERLDDASLTIAIEGSGETVLPLAAVEPGATVEVPAAFDTTLRPGAYAVRATIRVPGNPPWINIETVDVTLVPRPPPHRMPVVMWGVYSPDKVLEELTRLKEIGFTHALGLSADYEAIREAGEVVPPGVEDRVATTKRLLNEALAQDFAILATLSPGGALKNESTALRVNAKGEPQTNRPNICALAPDLRGYCRNVGESVARAYGPFPSFHGALLHTEVRDAAAPCHHEHDRAACRAATGADIPAGLSKGGRAWETIEGFPTDRIVPDDHPLLTYLRWYWKEGDGWNGLNTALHEGLKAGGVRPGFWTFHDPAVRVASTWGSGGAVDVLSQWTYSYPDPIRIGLATDELFAMARGAIPAQRVMKMTQIIWYRSQAAPTRAADTERAAAMTVWEDTDPTAAFLTISPMHLREAFWTQLARPIEGIMYHGWQSLVPCEGSTSSYRFTHPETRHELRRLITEVVKPLGPTLLQVPDAPADVAFLESFAAQMFAGRGSYGWGRGWAADAWHALQYAHLQPEIIYDETVLRDGLDRYKILCLFDCDVLTESVTQRILAFQKNGGLILADQRLAPGITPDIVVPIYSRTKNAQEDQAALMDRAHEILERLNNRYTRYVSTCKRLVIPRLRRYGTTDYVFAVNDTREFGRYVGQHGLVMENGLPNVAAIHIGRPAGFAYDLIDGAGVGSTQGEAPNNHTATNSISIVHNFGPGEGRVFMITDRPIAKVKIDAPGNATLGGSADIRIAVDDPDGKPLDAVIPLRVDIRDPDGRITEHSGWYGAKDGMLSLRLDFASNDLSGAWELRVRELASNRRAVHFITLQSPSATTSDVPRTTP